VTTPAGKINISSQSNLTHLTKGQNLQLHLVSAGPPVKLSITLQQSPSTTGQTTQSAASSTPSAKTPVSTKLNIGSQFKATVTQSTSSPPVATATKALSTSQPSQTQQGAAPSSSTTGQTTLPQGSALQVKLLSLQLPSQTPQSALSTSLSTTAGRMVLSGQVSGQTPFGQSQLATQHGQITLNTNQALPNGTKVSLEVINITRPDPAGNAADSQKFQSIREMISLLSALSSGQSQQLNQLIPQSGAQNAVQLSSALLFFVSALRGGGAERWVGDKGLKSLDRLKAGFSKRLDGDMKISSRQVKDTSGQDWRMHELPIAADGEIEHLRLYLRDQQNDEPDDSDDDKKMMQRFIIEANFTQLGPIQMDGLVRDKEINLVLRSHKSMDSEMRQEIRLLFHNTISALGLAGQVDFNTTPRFELSVDNQTITYRHV
jgi:hypothetical protein